MNNKPTLGELKEAAKKAFEQYTEAETRAESLMKIRMTGENWRELSQKRVTALDNKLAALDKWLRAKNLAEVAEISLRCGI